jgi:glutaredoxin/uncharacterized damage-inducible protein DinB
MIEPDYTIYWQPGCSSCLKAKEFLTARGIRYHSVNVHAEPEALRHLNDLGVKSVPVVERGSAFVMAQNLDELARFVGDESSRQQLPLPELAQRLVRVVTVARAQLAVMTPGLLAKQLRADRTLRDLAFHIYAVAEGFLDAAEGGALSEAHFYRLPDPGWGTSELSTYGEGVAHRFAGWWSAAAGEATAETYATYYGDQTAPELLERTCWHAAQHTRQVDAMLRGADLLPPDQLSSEDLAGLPLPDRVWDDELQAMQPMKQ